MGGHTLRGHPLLLGRNHSCVHMHATASCYLSKCFGFFYFKEKTGKLLENNLYVYYRRLIIRSLRNLFSVQKWTYCHRNSAAKSSCGDQLVQTLICRAIVGTPFLTYPGPELTTALQYISTSKYIAKQHCSVSASFVIVLAHSQQGDMVWHTAQSRTLLN